MPHDIVFAETSKNVSISHRKQFLVFEMRKPQKDKKTYKYTSAYLYTKYWEKQGKYSLLYPGKLLVIILSSKTDSQK